MTSAPPPEPDPVQEGRRKTTQEDRTEDSHPVEPAPASESGREDGPQGYQTNLGADTLPREPIRLSLSPDVRRRGLSPFALGVIVGAVAAIVGLLIGLAYFWLIP